MSEFVAPPGQEETLDRMAETANYNEWLLSRAAPLLGTTVLDFGAGLGTLTELLAADREVVAVEPDPAFVPRLRERFDGRANVHVVAGDADTLDRLDTRFDSIVCFNVLEHVPDDAATLRRFRAALRADGRLLLLVPAHPFLFGAVDESVGHHRRYRRRGLHALLAETGFEIDVLRFVNPVGAIGWLVSSRLLRNPQLPRGPLKLYDALVPALRALDALPLPFGLSLWVVARPSTIGSASASAAKT